ncbi:MAG: sortase [Anaerolineae bacterium]|nr:sortase [Anaerolineae bacterium]
MAKRSKDEGVIPLGVAFIVIGLVLVCTAVTLLLLLTYTPPQTIARIPAAVLPTAPPQAADVEIALLPETPLETEEALATPDENTLAFVRGQPERIVIPVLDLDAPVGSVGLIQVQNGGQTYYQWQVPPEFRAGWHNTSAPLGTAGNTVLNGHHNIHGEVFRDLAELEEGDEIIVYGRSQPYTYTVAAVEILPERDQPLSVRVQNASWINPTQDERLTLVTCWPYEDNSHRLVVVAHPVANNEHSTSNTNVIEDKN